MEMKEQEFDIFVRQTLQDAQEPVSPKVWEGVSAGLRRSRRVFPLWARYSLAGVAAAAAVVAGFVFLKPAPELQQHSNPTISVAQTAPAAPPAEAETVLPVKEQPSSPAVERPARRKAAVRPEESAAPVQAIAPASLPVQLQIAQHPQMLAIKADLSPRPVVDDNALLAQLAYSEARQQSPRGLSALVSGSLQGNQHGPSGGSHARPFGVPTFKSMLEEDVTEGPETSFGLPLSAGIGVKYDFSSRWAVGTGVRFTYLTRSFMGYYNGSIRTEEPTDIDNGQFWLGVPLNVYFTVVNLGRWRVHVMAGGAAEKLLDNRYLIHYSSKDIYFHKEVTSPLQWSVAGGLGAEYKLTPWMGIYLDPSFRYYFRTDLQPRSLRKIQPMRFDVELGLRFSFGK